METAEELDITANVLKYFAADVLKQSEAFSTAEISSIHQAIYTKAECKLMKYIDKRFVRHSEEVNILPLFTCNNHLHLATPCKLNIHHEENVLPNDQNIDTLKETTVIVSRNTDLIVPPQSMQHVRCTNDRNHRSKTILQYASDISCKDKQTLKTAPKVMVKFAENYKEVISITPYFYITFEVVCILCLQSDFNL